MIKLALAIGLFLVFAVRTSTAGPSRFDEDHQKRAEKAIKEAIEKGECPGAVLLIGTKDGTIFKKAYGHRAIEPEKVAMTEDTIFDLASLSKPIGCATSIMILADRGKLSVTDPVSKHIPGMKRDDKKEITIEQCLLHRSGFVADNSLKDFVGTRNEMLDRVYARELKYEPGKDFTYSDNGFIVLGEVVAAVSGERLDSFAMTNIFKPLKMTDTSYGALKENFERVAPTEKRDGKFMLGEVHDPRAYALGHVAGHAGVFGTADDVARWCRMLLNGGQLEGQRILSEATVREMTTKRAFPDGKHGRGYGVDFTSSLATSPRGDRFAEGLTYGHTGWTGTMFWIDPTNDVFFVLLTNRVHPDGKGDVKDLRRNIATIVAEALLGPASPSKPAAD